MEEYIFYGGSRVKNLKGKTFGQLRVDDFVKIENRYAIWRCTCLKCGKECDVSAKNLLSGRQETCKDCKVPKKRARKAEYLTGKDFGFLHVEYLVPDKKYEKYLCTCKCGNTTVVSRSNLLSGNVKSCGCMAKKDIQGQVFGFLTAIKPTEKSSDKGILWECKCKCGNVVYVPTRKLTNKDIRSCGCMGEVEKEQHTKITWVVNGQALRPDNTSGHRGVNRANGKWGARITFKKKEYWLGTFDKKEDAIAAREEAEKHLYSDFLEWYKQFSEERNKKGGKHLRGNGNQQTTNKE